MDSERLVVSAPCISYNLLLPIEAISAQGVLFNCLNTGRYVPIQKNWLCTWWHVDTSTENIQSIVDHPFKLTLIHCSSFCVAVSTNVISSTAVGSFNLGLSWIGLNLWLLGWFCSDDNGNCFVWGTIWLGRTVIRICAIFCSIIAAIWFREGVAAGERRSIIPCLSWVNLRGIVRVPMFWI